MRNTGSDFSLLAASSSTSVFALQTITEKAQVNDILELLEVLEGSCRDLAVR